MTFGERRGLGSRPGEGVSSAAEQTPGCRPQGLGRAGGARRWALCMTLLPEGGPEVGTSVTAPTLDHPAVLPPSGSGECSSPGGPSCPAKQVLGKATLVRWEEILPRTPHRHRSSPNPHNGMLRDEPGSLPHLSGVCPAPRGPGLFRLLRTQALFSQGGHCSGQLWNSRAGRTEISNNGQTLGRGSQ